MPENLTLPNMPKPVSAQPSAIVATGENSTNKNELVGRTVDSVERELILDTLDYCLGNRTHAANILGISIRTLRNKLKQYGDGLQDTGT